MTLGDANVQAIKDLWNSKKMRRKPKSNRRVRLSEPSARQGGARFGNVENAMVLKQF